MDYTHLTRDQRYQIQGLLSAGQTQVEIARIVGCHPSTICRELKRSGMAKGYCAEEAQLLALERAAACANGPRVDVLSWQMTEEGLCEGWSPEAVSGRLRLEGYPGISHATIYRRIHADRGRGGSLWRYLRCRKARRKRRGDGRGRPRPVGARPIEMRPAEVQTRSTFGHWEGDTMLDSWLHGALVTIVERKSRYTVAAKVKRKTARLVKQAIKRLLHPFAPLTSTLTVDNGKEFSDHENLGIDCYFARPYASWQRGTVENTNGLLREYFPRSRRLSGVRPDQVRRAVDKLNHRPRKCLGFRTPHEVFMEALDAVALRE